MPKAKILSVCGSGTITSAMVSSKLTDNLSTRGWIVSCGECKPEAALGTADMGDYDLIVHTSPLPPGDYPCETVSSFPCVCGIGEEQFFDDVEAALKRTQGQDART